MRNVQEIKRAVSQLSSADLTDFRVWFAEFDAEVWDRQFEEDVAAGRLNSLAERALQHLSAGRCSDLQNHRATPDFWFCYRQLPIEIQDLADRCCLLLKQDSQHPSLHFKKVTPFWSVRIGIHYRALAIESENEMAWFWIVSCAEYDRLLRWQSNLWGIGLHYNSSGSTIPFQLITSLKPLL